MFTNHCERKSCCHPCLFMEWYMWRWDKTCIFMCSDDGRQASFFISYILPPSTRRGQAEQSRNVRATLSRWPWDTGGGMTFPGNRAVQLPPPPPELEVSRAETRAGAGDSA